MKIKISLVEVRLFGSDKVNPHLRSSHCSQNKCRLDKQDKMEGMILKSRDRRLAFIMTVSGLAALIALRQQKENLWNKWDVICGGLSVH